MPKSTINWDNIPPEILVYNTISTILQLLREDTVQYQAEPEKMILYDILYDMNLLKHNYFEEGVDLFSRKPEHPRSVDIRQFFDAERAKDPTIHITLSSDNQGGDSSIGISQDEFYYEEDTQWEEDETQYTGTQTSPVYGRSFDISLQLVFTSVNHHEVMIMYYVIRSCLIAAFDSLDLSGFQNVKYSGRELQIREDIAPNIFSRGLTLSGFYEVRVRRFLKDKRLREIFVEKSTPYITQEIRIN